MGSFPPSNQVYAYCLQRRRNRYGGPRRRESRLRTMLNVQEKQAPICFSIGIMAWNEEKSICRTLESLFKQSVFEKLHARGERCRIVIVANGCTDGTVAVTREFFARMKREHPYPHTFDGVAVDLPQPGRNNAWNRYVHEHSARESRFIYLMDADIVFHHRDTIYSMFHTLEKNPRAAVASDRQYKEIFFKEKKTLRDRLSLATSNMTGTIAGRFTGQLYCMRAEIARNIYLPRDLGATDDGFMKAVICTNFLTAELDPERIVTAPDAAHIFEAYVSTRDVLNNQKRQMIGQTTVHVVLGYLKTLSVEERLNFAETIRQLEARDPDWLKRLIDEHVGRTRYFWQLFPGLLGFRFRRLLKLRGIHCLTHLPAACAGFVVTMISCWRAYHFMRRGQTAYWPKATRQTILSVPPVGAK
jgi:glycosyltransferase involved in cell wall biosynthesis